MYVLKNAWKSITRNIGRNVLIGIIVTVIATASAVTLAIRESAKHIVESYENMYSPKASIGMNREALMGNFRNQGSQEGMIDAFNDIESLSLEEIKEYGESKYVDNFYYNFSLGVNGSDLTDATDSLIKETTETQVKTEEFGGGRPGDAGGRKTSMTTTKTESIFNAKKDSGVFTLIGYDAYSAMEDFINGKYTITSGEVTDDFTSSSCVVSEELAQLNDLEVGSVITLVNPNNSKLTYEATVTGIYKENSDESTSMNNMFTNSANTIFTTIEFIEKIAEDDEEMKATITPTYILKSSDDFDDFASEVAEKGLSEYYTVTNNLSEIESATESVLNVKTFATTFLVITLIIGGVVLAVVNMINIRERKYEIGVLRTIGLKKWKLTLQFMLESLIVAVIGLLVGAMIGSTMSVSVSNRLLANEIENATSKYNDIGKNFGKDFGGAAGEMNGRPDMNDLGIANVSAVENIDAVVNFSVLVKLLCLGIILVLLASMSQMVAISRFSPLTILKERS